MTSYLQAYHTSCREGLSGSPGFQYNAASPELTPEALRALASTHAGYTAPRDAPLEPTIEQLGAFPIALKFCPVDGVGAVVSRTAYVGREFRGRGGEEDAGRFGNYFSHMVVGEDSPQPFGDLLPIELWGASHWSTAESPETALAPLGPLAPGRLDLESMLGRFDAPRRAWLAAVLDAVLASLFGGPRVVVLEPDAARAADWVGWVSFALPAELARTLTFTTFEGRPRFANDIRLCITTPGCDVDFAPQEIGRSVVAFTPLAGGEPPARTSLYARVAAVMAETGAEQLAQVVRKLGSRASAEQLGAELALRAGRGDLVEDAEVPAVLELLEQFVAEGHWQEATDAAAGLPAEANPASLPGWVNVHAASRRSPAPEAQELADLALDRLVPAIGRIAFDAEPISPEAPTSPSPRRLAAWLERLDEAGDPRAFAEQMDAGLRLGLVGCNAALDRRVGALLAAALPDADARRAFDRLAAEEATAVAFEAAVAALGAKAVEDEATFELLGGLFGDRRVREALRTYVSADAGFETYALWQRVRASADPRTRAEAVQRLLEADRGSARAALLARSIYGPAGPTQPKEQTELLDAYSKAGVPLPAPEVDRAISMIAATPLKEAKRVSELMRALVDADPRLASDAVPYAIKLGMRPPSGAVAVDEWADRLHRLGSLHFEGDAERMRELSRIAAMAAANRYEDPGYSHAMRAFAEVYHPKWPQFVADAVSRSLTGATRPARTVARLYRTWSRMPGADTLVHEVLPEALASWSRRQLERVSDELNEHEVEHWEAWMEDHPPAGMLERRGAKRGLKRSQR